MASHIYLVGKIYVSDNELRSMTRRAKCVAKHSISFHCTILCSVANRGHSGHRFFRVTKLLLVTSSFPSFDDQRGAVGGA